MVQVVHKEGLRAPLFFCALMVLAFSGALPAQEIDKRDLERCAALPNSELKLACFEALAGTGEPAATYPAATDAAEAMPVPDAVPVEAADTAAVSADPPQVQQAKETDPGPDQISALAAEPEPAGGPQADPGTALESTPAAAPAPTREPRPAAERAVAASITSAEIPAAFGAEYLDRDVPQADELPVAVTATVARVTVGFGRRLFFYFDNGQVWRQTTKAYVQYPKDETFEVEITRGMMGDYRLRVGGEGRMTRIIRVE